MCGHGPLHPNRRLEAALGFVLHSLLLVPYFTWQRSHAVHHANCNYLEGGETHVPPHSHSPAGPGLVQSVNPPLCPGCRRAIAKSAEMSFITACLSDRID